MKYRFDVGDHSGTNKVSFLVSLHRHSSSVQSHNSALGKLERNFKHHRILFTCPEAREIIPSMRSFASGEMTGPRVVSGLNPSPIFNVLALVTKSATHSLKREGKKIKNNQGEQTHTLALPTKTATDKAMHRCPAAPNAAPTIAERAAFKTRSTSSIRVSRFLPLCLRQEEQQRGSSRPCCFARACHWQFREHECSVLPCLLRQTKSPETRESNKKNSDCTRSHLDGRLVQDEVNTVVFAVDHIDHSRRATSLFVSFV